MDHCSMCGSPLKEGKCPVCGVKPEAAETPAGEDSATPEATAHDHGEDCGCAAK